MAANTILVTGAMGFAGTHLRAALRASFPHARIVGTGLHACEDILALDITARDAVHELIASLRPDVCVHLAGIAAIGAARANPEQAWAINLHGTLNIADAIMAGAPHCRLMFVSSAECYGASFKPGRALDETALLAPINLYAATKAAADLALGARAAEGLRLLRLRPFNHTGPGQSEDFVVPAFAGQIARIEAGFMPPEIAVGSLEPERDFLDIRDICAAYMRCVECDEDLSQNEIFNLASGRAVKIGTVLGMLLERAKCPISIRTDPARLRPVEIPRAIGDAAHAANMLGWTPKFPLGETLDTVLDFARRKTISG